MGNRAATVRSLAAAALAAAACGGGGGAPGLPRDAWTWVDLTGTECSDGSQTGVAVNPGDRPDLLVFLDGGGACWDAVTCFTLHLARPGPYGRAQFEADLARRVPGSVLDRAAPGNPFASFTLVFIPYCTGDVHGGDTVQDYPGAPRPWHHHGRANVARAIDLVASSLPAPPRLVVSGSSGGGFGAVVSMDAFRRRFPSAKGYLVDDSGPLLVGDDLNPAIRAAWLVAWRLDEVVLPVCPDCVTDLSRFYPALARRYPDDRLALLSFTRDPVISGYFLLGPDAFEAALLRLAGGVLAPLANARTFLVPGASHAMLRDPQAISAGGIALPEWMRQQVEDEPGWRSVGP